MGMVSSQLEILGNRLKNIGTEIVKNEVSLDKCNENRQKLRECIQEHQRILQ